LLVTADLLTTADFVGDGWSVGDCALPHPRWRVLIRALRATTRVRLRGFTYGRFAAGAWVAPTAGV